MDLIFYNGEKLLQKENEVFQLGKQIQQKFGCIHINQYQSEMLDIFFGRNKKEFNIYGDDYKIEITPKNIEGDCIINFKDYDENQTFEKEVAIGFSKDELSQFITLLQTIKDRL